MWMGEYVLSLCFFFSFFQFPPTNLNVVVDDLKSLTYIICGGAVNGPDFDWAHMIKWGPLRILVPGLEFWIVWCPIEIVGGIGSSCCRKAQYSPETGKGQT